MKDIVVISKYRSILMGFAIIWIMLFHYCYIVEPEIFEFFPIRNGYGGVDIFLFLSGFGLYYSYTKDGGANLRSFYIKRFIRVLPSFWLVIVVYDIITHNVSTATFFRLSTLGFWIPTLPYSYWYISSIIAFYLLFPLYMHFYAKYKEICLIVVILIGVVLTSLYTVTNHTDISRNEIVFFLSRIPVFYIGVSFGRLSKDNKKMSTKNYLVLSICSLCSLLFLYIVQGIYGRLFLQNTAMDQYPYIILTPFICLSLPWLLQKTHFLNKVLAFLGAISLELYLVHLKLLYFFRDRLVADSIWTSALHLIVFLAICILLSYIINKLVKMIFDRVQTRIIAL